MSAPRIRALSGRNDPLRLPVRTMMALLAAALVPAVAAAQPKADEPAPPLSVERLLNAPDDASAEWGALKGKVVVVEFWATWCAPCIASIPHLNELAEQFRDEDVVFISLVDTAERGSLSLRDQELFKQRFNVAASRARDQMWIVH